MEEKIDIWLLGNTGLRNPNRIQEGFKAFVNSPYVGKLRGKENEMAVDVFKKWLYLSKSKEKGWRSRRIGNVR